MTNKYGLVLLSEEYFKELYNWNNAEKHFELYTCRPINPQKSYKEYIKDMEDSINNKNTRTYILVNTKEPLGKINLFDYNPRNHSAEFGYYMPEKNRNKGYGKIMLEQFLTLAFSDENFKLNKLYATTSSNNLASMKLLEKLDFKLDGRLREHYWINENKYDQCVYSMLKSQWINR